MEPSFAFDDHFGSTLFDFSGVCWPNHETLYGGFFETIHDPHEPAFTSNNMDFIGSMKKLALTSQSAVISTSLPPSISHLSINTLDSNGTRKTSGEGILDPSGLSRPWGEKSHPYTIQSGVVGHQQAPYSLLSSTARLGSTSKPTTGCVRPCGDSRTHRSAPSRNQPATTDQVDEIMLWLNRDKFSEANGLVCPVRGCTHKQVNGRIQDFRRHLGTHLRKNGEIRCKGVPWERFLRDPHLFPKISTEEQPYTIPEDEEDGLWVGGCLKTFSRADALKRHLRKSSCGTS